MVNRAEREGMPAACRALPAGLAVSGQAPVVRPAESLLNTVRTLPIFAYCSATRVAGSVEYPPTLIVGSKRAFMPQSESPK